MNQKKPCRFTLSRCRLAAVMLASLVSGCDGRVQQDALSQKDLARLVSEAKVLIAKGQSLETISQQVWKEILTPEQYRIMWEKGTERAFTGALLNNQSSGTYVTAGCRLPVFHSRYKFKSGTGWPSFWEVVDKDNVVLKKDFSWGMVRTEVLSKCGEHLGHVFDDGPDPTGLRYCINSAALVFVPDNNKREAVPSQGN